MRKAAREEQRHASKLGREITALKEMPENQIDTSDIPEVRNWRGAVTGRFYRPVKTSVTIRLDADVLAWFRSRGGRYQTSVNRVLREFMLAHR